MKAILKKVLAINLLAMLIVAICVNTGVASAPNHDAKVKAVKSVKIKKHRKPTVSSWSCRYYGGQDHTCADLVAEHLGGFPTFGGPIYWSGTLGVGTILFSNAALTSALNSGTVFTYGGPGYPPNVFRFVVDFTGKVTSVTMCY